ncbi:MAG: DUF262 domain-containing protein [Chloroflexi bacterium]|nr:DUF262 domain-containing protein [Chloroflexota bacterium]
MKKRAVQWSIRKLEKRFYQIQFPEYQREPNLWNLTEKQRLIDSISRQFDISALYFYVHSDGAIDCVDGRQRIGAVMSFVGKFSTDDHPNFQFRTINEIYNDVELPFRALNGMSFAEIKSLAKKPNGENRSIARQFVDTVMDYKLTIVVLSDSLMADEFNLQFTRLNLGVIINSGEKLHAMVGDFRNECFGRLGKHGFLENTNIPTRRFAREQVAAQILAQVFSIEADRRFIRTRHFDLQRVFKQNSKFEDAHRELIIRLTNLFDLLESAFENVTLLRNRAITVSTVLLAWRRGIDSYEQAGELASFIEEFLLRLSWQVKKRLLADPEYHYLLGFQRHITQASAERSSVEARDELLADEFSLWLKAGELKGDSSWRKNHPGKDPSEESRN